MDVESNEYLCLARTGIKFAVRKVMILSLFSPFGCIPNVHYKPNDDYFNISLLLLLLLLMMLPYFCFQLLVEDYKVHIYMPKHNDSMEEDSFPFVSGVYYCSIENSLQLTLCLSLRISSCNAVNWKCRNRHNRNDYDDYDHNNTNCVYFECTPGYFVKCSRVTIPAIPG